MSLYSTPGDGSPFRMSRLSRLPFSGTQQQTSCTSTWRSGQNQLSYTLFVLGCYVIWQPSFVTASATVPCGGWQGECTMYSRYCKQTGRMRQLIVVGYNSVASRVYQVWDDRQWNLVCQLITHHCYYHYPQTVHIAYANSKLWWNKKLQYYICVWVEMHGILDT
jgi:hypothetical protein